MRRRISLFLIIGIAIAVALGTEFSDNSTDDLASESPQPESVLSADRPAPESALPPTPSLEQVEEDPQSRASNFTAVTIEFIDETVPRLPVWPGYARERELIDGYIASDDLQVFVAAVAPYADAGDPGAVFITYQIITDCGVIKNVYRGTDFQSTFDTLSMQEAERSPSDSRRLGTEMALRCHALLDTDLRQAKATWAARLEEIGHPIADVDPAYAQFNSGDHTDIRERFRRMILSGHPSARSAAGSLGVLVDGLHRGLDVRGELVSSERSAWGAMSCIEGRRIRGLDPRNCFGPWPADPDGELDRARLARITRAGEIATSILDEDWDAIGLSDPPPETGDDE
jgi:hypothetical protein